MELKYCFKILDWGSRGTNVAKTELQTKYSFNMKNFIASILFLTLITGVSCHSQENIKVVSIVFHSDDCGDCNALKSKIKKMNRAFFTSPIVFIK